MGDLSCDGYMCGFVIGWEVIVMNNDVGVVWEVGSCNNEVFGEEVNGVECGFG